MFRIKDDKLIPATENKISKTNWIIGVLAVIFVVGIAMNKKDEPAQTAAATAPARSNDEQILYVAQHVAKKAIKNESKDPESVHFLEMMAEQYYPGTTRYVCKWRITGTNSFGARVQAQAVASVHFKGGDTYHSDNYEVDNVRFIED